MIKYKDRPIAKLLYIVSFQNLEDRYQLSSSGKLAVTWLIVNRAIYVSTDFIALCNASFVSNLSRLFRAWKYYGEELQGIWVRPECLNLTLSWARLDSVSESTDSVSETSPKSRIGSSFCTGIGIIGITGFKRLWNHCQIQTLLSIPIFLFSVWLHYHLSIFFFSTGNTDLWKSESKKNGKESRFR